MQFVPMFAPTLFTKASNATLPFHSSLGEMVTVITNVCFQSYVYEAFPAPGYVVAKDRCSFPGRTFPGEVAVTFEDDVFSLLFGPVPFWPLSFVLPFEPLSLTSVLLSFPFPDIANAATITIATTAIAITPMMLLLIRITYLDPRKYLLEHDI